MTLHDQQREASLDKRRSNRRRLTASAWVEPAAAAVRKGWLEHVAWPPLIEEVYSRRHRVSGVAAHTGRSSATDDCRDRERLRYCVPNTVTLAVLVRRSTGCAVAVIGGGGVLGGRRS